MHRYLSEYVIRPKCTISTRLMAWEDRKRIATNPLLGAISQKGQPKLIVDSHYLKWFLEGVLNDNYHNKSECGYYPEIVTHVSILIS